MRRAPGLIALYPTGEMMPYREAAWLGAHLMMNRTEIIALLIGK